MAHRFTAGVALTLLAQWMLVPLIARASSPTPLDETALALQLFPQAQTWQPLTQLEPTPQDWLHAQAAALRSAYLASDLATHTGDNGSERERGCSFIARALSTEIDPAGFRRADLDGDGLVDVLYVGPSHCSEADLSLLWMQTAEGFALGEHAYGRALMIRPGPPVALLLRINACCGERVDRYRIFEAGVGPSADRGIESATSLPAMLTESNAFASRRSLVLRRSPERDETARDDLSEWAQQPVRGNRLDSYAAGTSGRVHARQADPSGRSWCFISLDTDANSLKTSAPFDVDVGWVECARLRQRR